MYPWMWKILGLPWPSSSLVTLRYSGFFRFTLAVKISANWLISCYISSIWLSKGLGNPWKPRNHQLISTAFWTAVHREATRHKAFRGQLGVTQSATVEISPQVWVAFIRLENVSVTCHGFSIHSNCIQMSTFLVCNPMLQHTYTNHDRPTGLPWSMRHTARSLVDRRGVIQVEIRELLLSNVPLLSPSATCHLFIAEMPSTKHNTSLQDAIESGQVTLTRNRTPLNFHGNIRDN
jgi:hypothetical protein